MNQRTKHFQLRLTPEEAHQLREKSKSYSSVSHYIRSAVAEYSDINAKQRLALINELGTFYRKFQNELSWAGGNLNQLVKRTNELSVAGLLSQAYLQEVLLPVIRSFSKAMMSASGLFSSTASTNAPTPADGSNTRSGRMPCSCRASAIVPVISGGV